MSTDVLVFSGGFLGPVGHESEHRALSGDGLPGEKVEHEASDQSSRCAGNLSGCIKLLLFHRISIFCVKRGFKGKWPVLSETEIVPSLFGDSLKRRRAPGSERQATSRRKEITMELP